MEWLKNIVTPISERVKSPFYSTLLISWLMFNWRIIVGLFFYNEYINKIDKITYIGQLLGNCWTTIVFPLLSTILYLFVLPRLDEFIFGFTEKSRQRKLEKKINITKAGIVNGERHINLYNKFMKLKDELSAVEKDLIREKEQIDKIKAERDNFKNENYQIQANLQELGNEINLYHNRNLINLPHKNIYEFSIYEEGEFSQPKKFFGKFFVESLNKINIENKDENHPMYEIIWFEYIKSERKIKFLCSNKLSSNDNSIFIFDLKFIGENTYEGVVKNLSKGKEFKTIMKALE